MTGQDEVVAFLASGAAFPGGGPVSRVDTHGAIIFLCGDRALKLKRAVRYDYMDLSTPDLRHRMLLRELALNAPAAPTIYRDVVAVTRGDQGLCLDGAGETVDWVLRMNRFPAENELEAVAARGDLDGALAEALGQMVWHYHSACPLRSSNGAVLIRAILDELDRVFSGFGNVPGTADLAVWKPASRKALDAVASLLRDRGMTGHVRRGHGDLHLRNIVLIDGRPVPYDALEFDETLGTCDVLYDLAFLLMDLGHRGLREAATRVLSGYLLAARGVDDAGLTALPLFLSVRAAIRAMVLLQTDAARGQPGASAVDVAGYLAQAIAALATPAPQLVVVAGLSGSGKTALSRALSPMFGAAPGAVHLTTDAERKTAAGVAVGERLTDAAYAPAMRDAVYDRLFQRAENILRTGYSVIIDGTFLDPDLRRQAADLGRRRGVRTHCLWLSAPTDVLTQRIMNRRGDASDAGVGVLHAQLARDPGQIDWTVIDAGGTLAATLAAASAHVAPGNT